MMFFHGEPGSRLSGVLLSEHATAAGVRLIAVDRPGFGLSTFQPGRTRRDWPTDVEHLADHLALGRFAALGWSAGGPYALVCAALLPHRLQAAAVLAGVGGPAGFNPALARSLLRLRPDTRPETLADLLTRAWMRTKSVAGGGEVAQEAAGAIATGIREGLRPGTAGALHELRIMTGAWDFDPGTISGVPVRFWHGKADAVVPDRQTRRLAARVPGAHATYLPRAGHVSLLTVHGGNILSDLVDTWR